MADPVSLALVTRTTVRVPVRDGYATPALRGLGPGAPAPPRTVYEPPMVTGPVSLEEAVDLLREALPYLPACISTEEEIEDFLLRYDAAGESPAHPALEPGQKPMLTAEERRALLEEGTAVKDVLRRMTEPMHSGLRCRYCALPVGGPTAAEGGLVERCYGHSHVTAINYVEAP